MTTFGEAYARVYDLLYADKDYRGECDIIARLVGAPPKRIADFGCGTGTHAIELARRGYGMVGVDASRAMLARARAKSPELELVHGDMRDLRLTGRFDAVLCLFAALGYVTDDADLRRAFAGFRALVDPGAPLVFDCWYGPTVLRLRPEKREKRVQGKGTTVVRCATPVLQGHICTTHYELEIGSGERFTEAHAMRFFFPDELQHLLSGAGFALERVAPFPRIDEPIDDRTWNVVVVARAR